MSQFSHWFNDRYNEWVKSQPGEEDFLSFCSLLGFPPKKVLEWLQGESNPDGPEGLCIAGLFGDGFYDGLDLPKPDPMLMEIFLSFPHIKGQDRSDLALAIFEVGNILKERKLSENSLEAKEIFKHVFSKHGLYEVESSEDQVDN